jgi:N-acetyl-gamma-glutamylphosphate reductase
LNTRTIAIAGKNDQHRLTSEWLQKHPGVSEVRSIDITRLFHPAETEKMLSSDVMLCMLPDGVSTTLWQWLHEHAYEGYFIDTGIDFRLKNRDEAIRYYRHEGFETAIANQFRYIHPDLNLDEVMPGHRYYCLPGTVSTLLLPPLKAVVSSQKPDDLWITSILPNYVETESRIQAFQVFTYFETGEIIAAAEKWTGKLPKLSIIPVHMSVSRGSWTTITVDNADHPAIEAAMEVLIKGRTSLTRVPEIPSLGDVLNTCRIQIGYKKRGTKMVVGAAMDDQIKAGPGIVIPVLNALFGHVANTGLQL